MLEQSHPGSTATVNAASPPSSQSAAQENLSRCLNALKVAEEKKIEDPKSCVLALAYTADAATQCDRELPKHTGPFYSEDGDRYFKLAVDLYAKNKWDKQNSDEIADMLYQQLGQRSWKVVESVFEELFKASERHLEGKFERHDVSIYFGLSQREQKMPLQVQRKLLEKAIEIRRIARKNESWRLAPLYDDLAWCFRDAGDIKGAETNFLGAISMLEPDPVEQARALVNLARFYVDSGMYDKANSTWRRSAALTKQKHLVWGVQDYVNLVHTYIGRQQPKYLPPLFDVLITNGDEFTFISLDPMLVKYIEKQIELGELEPAAVLIKKRIVAAPGHGVKPGSENWKIRLSNIYLAQGKTTESQALFNQAISDLERTALPTSDYKSSRAKLLENIGMHNEAKTVSATLPTNSLDITLPACIVVKDKIEFGNDSSLISFDSSDDNDPVMQAHGRSCGFMRVMPPEGDGSILSFGSISGSDISYFGTIHCNKSTLTQPQNRRAKILPIEHVFQIQEGIDPPPDARTVVPVIEAGVKMLERGDYILTDLGDLTVRPQTLSAPIRVFLQDSDSPDKEEFVLSLHGQPVVSFRQFQVWYKGSKTIKLRSAGGLIYAPNARVELPFGTGFMGAIVAREFKSANSSSIWLDRGVLNKNLTR
jgi:tetratricopeptide (TPR) repeat protein